MISPYHSMAHLLADFAARELGDESGVPKVMTARNTVIFNYENGRTTWRYLTEPEYQLKQDLRAVIEGLLAMERSTHAHRH